MRRSVHVASAPAALRATALSLLAAAAVFLGAPAEAAGSTNQYLSSGEIKEARAGQSR